MARTRAPPASNQPIPPLVPPTTENSRVVTPETGIPQALAPIQLTQWLTGVTQVSKLQQAPTKVVTQRDPTVVTTPNPGPENDTVAAQAARKLTFFAGSSTIEPVVPRKNNRAPKRALPSEKAAKERHNKPKKAAKTVTAPPTGVAHKQDVVLKPVEVPKGVGDPKGKKKQIPQSHWQARQVTQVDTSKTNEIAKEDEMPKRVAKE
ncbi:hypothetical protein K7X08_037982 [Anisodus acutangulus]|uniref:Uncharacterized protein n=1 Tax=Anisodus acutangulus TaxID=402998 RepID=A0A9Q1N131_9SOLA|nr:hypothetical protein K7X08_037982 [Anisodus acutangulus]